MILQRPHGAQSEGAPSEGARRSRCHGAGCSAGGLEPGTAYLAGLLDQSALPQPRVRDQVVTAYLTTAHSHDDWQRALVRLGASGTLEATGMVVVIEHDATDETLRLHAPERTDVDRVREVVGAAAVTLGVMR